VIVSETVRLYKVTEVMQILSVGHTYVYDLINSGRLPVVELGSTRAKQRVRADDLQAFIDQRTHGKSSVAG
jgi:excisionase family DNA binding protein